MNEESTDGVIGPAPDARPCPFCGFAEHSLVFDRDRELLIINVECGGCGCLGPYVTNSPDPEIKQPGDAELQARAVQLWNQRA